MNFKLDNRVYKYQERGASESVVGFKVVKFDYSPAEGFETYLEDFSYPIRGFVGEEITRTLNSGDIVKKSILKDLKILSVKPIKYLAPFLFFLPSKWFINILETWFYSTAELMRLALKEWIMDEKYYTRPVKEIMRAIRRGEENLTRDRISEGLGAILEVDRPYRYQLMDLVLLVNKEWLLQNPAKEIRRILRIFASRNQARNYWGKAIFLIYWLIKTRPEIKKEVLAFFAILDQGKMEFDIADKYGCFLNEGYDYLGLTQEQRVEEWKKIHDVGKEKEILAKKN